MIGPDLLPIFAQLAASIGLLTPLILGLYGFSRDKKKEAVEPAVLAKAVEEAESPASVDFENVAVLALKAQIGMHEKHEADLERNLLRVRDERDRARAALIAAGLPFP